MNVYIIVTVQPTNQFQTDH